MKSGASALDDMEEAFIAFGSNQGAPEEICLQAIETLRGSSSIVLKRVSSLYRSKPVGFLEQPWFINGAVRCETDLTPEELLQALHRVENLFGRTRTMRWGPRTLDLDILFFGQRRIAREDLIIPHARLHERLFVLVPLAEIAPDFVHPGMNMTVGQLLERLSGMDPGQVVLRLEKP